MSDAMDMFDLIWAPGNHSLCYQINGSPFKAPYSHDKAEDLTRTAQLLPKEANIWFGLHGMKPVAKGRGGVDDVVAVTCLGADFDWADSTAHKGADLPSEMEVRLAVSLMPQPTVVVNSGHGLQVYWGLAEELGPVEGQELIDGFFRWIEAEFGLHNDRTDLASVMRLPGTFNNKGEPVEVVIERLDPECGYHADWLRQNCWLAPVVPIVPPVPRETTPPLVISGLTAEQTGETPFDWLNRTFDSHAALLRLGWVEGHRRGSEVQFTRPGKDPRHGTSATLHTDTGAINIYSSSVDSLYNLIGLAGKGCVTLKPADLWMVENGIVDRSMASSMARQQMPTTQGPRAVAKTAPDHPVQEADTRQDVAVEANLPDEFWASRAYLAHIRQAALDRGASPDAVLGAVIARYAAAIPPTFQIPPIIMTASTFDHMSVLVAESGGGKSGAMGIAEELFLGPQFDRNVWDLPISSGEGLVASFFEMKEKEVDGKKTMVNTKTKDSVHFGVDEALGLVEQAGRAGTTIGSVLCTAWSGGNPGQANASADRRRVGMDRWTYRVAGVAGIQLSLGHRLLEDTFVHQGLSGRLVFFAAEDPAIPHWSEAPEWPGPLNLPVHPTMPVVMEYASSIVAEVKEQHWLKVTKQVHVAPIDSHTNLVKLKLSGIFALMEDRLTVTESDWALASAVVSSHLVLRNRMLAVKKQHQYEKTVTAATAQGTFDDLRDDVKERKALARLRDSIIRHVPEEGIGKNALRKVTAGPSGRDRFPMALQKALDDGAIKLVENRYFLT